MESTAPASSAPSASPASTASVSWTWTPNLTSTLWLAAVPLAVGGMIGVIVSRRVYNAEGKKRPEEMLALQTTAKGKIEVCRVPVPTPKRGEVLIKMSHAPVNPSDIYCAMDRSKLSTEPTYPHGIGYEGSGVVVGSGGGLLGYWAMLRKWRVSTRDLAGDGKFWAEYAVAKPSNTPPLPDSVDLREGCLANVNPLTALSMLIIAQEEGHKALVHTAASSTLGLQLLRAAPAFGIKIVAVVRGEKNARMLRQTMKHPADLVVRTDVANFKSDLKRAVRSTEATLAFDAIGGDVARAVYGAMPEKARVYTYGNLSGEGMPKELGDKKNDAQKPYSYYLVGPWLIAGGLRRLFKVSRYQFSMLPHELASSVDREISMDDPALIDLLYAYADHQKSGKVIMRMPHKSDGRAGL
ncbi:Enoyl-acyl-carrier-protein reductase, mitochondrial [Hondaea fermentalgiana]|uniref:Enoyl-acyl-carrier-protein reductase, mitochondrial n=1 Tax=Hondaea fermentalgiana TaxID=2315210 RepID=A0A2R5G6Q0_9STRA|nr:Enoyl-acyl-carrier-protein reductase, mitochondrial [Hondaea fermentalgiana]|eukprot:GBG26670.1 Enoyl-acyl-carrier-protein reductase, mitochondrial [Hondaea fermentalgiana]